MPNPMLEVTPAVVQADGKGRIANTGAQAGAAGALVIVGNWAAHQIGWNGDLPIEVAAAMQLLLTSAAAWWVNRKKLAGEVAA